MTYKVENVEKNVILIEIEVPAETFEEAVNKSYRKNAAKYRINGFRPGKAPRYMIEREYGEGVFYDDAINFACPPAYDEVVEEGNLHPVEKPEIDIKQIGKGQVFIFTAKVTVKPDVELGKYFGVQVEKEDEGVKDEDVEAELQRAADSHSRLVTIEDRPVKEGDTAVIDFEGFVDGVPFAGGKGEGYSLVIGSGQFIPGFEDQLIGAAAGEERDVNVTFPEDYNAEELKGKAALFKVKVNSIKVKEVPAIDDEFAKDVSEFDTLADYKADLRKHMEEDAAKKSKIRLENDVLAKVVENSVIDLPGVMIENQIDRLVEDFSWRLKYQGIEMDKYLQITGMDMTQMRDQFRERAEKEIRTQLVIEKITDVEKTEASDEDFEAEIAKLAENYKQSPDDFRKQLTPEDIEYIKRDIKFRNTVDMLVNKAETVKAGAAKKAAKKMPAASADEADEAGEADKPEAKPAAKKTVKKAPAETEKQGE